MVIEDIGYTSQRISEKEKREKEEKERRIYLKLEETFNKEAKKRNSPYRILTRYICPHLYLIEKWFFNLFENKKELNQIYYHRETNQFSFIYGLDEKIFKAIEPILNNIDIKFDIELNTGEVPIKYKILENLK